MNLFEGVLRCPVCTTTTWHSAAEARKCVRCGYMATINGRHISLLPEHLSPSNQREADYFDTMNETQRSNVEAYSLAKPYNYPRATREEYLRCCTWINEQIRGLEQSDPSILFVFGGGGMEAHLSGLTKYRTVLADISRDLLRQAELRFSHYNVDQPEAFVACDAERLPFADSSFDLVVGFEGIHHCLVPQASLQEIWRVAKKRAFVVDNYECSLTNALFSVGKSSVVEYTGVKPSRFTKSALKTLMQNAGITDYDFRYYASIPFGIVRRAGYWPSRLASLLLERVGQTNKFSLVINKAVSS
jgi:SAM-dependent methyltransferase